MAVKKYYHDIDLDGNQLISSVIENRTSAPVSAVDGQVYYNTIDKKAYFYNAGTASWEQLGSGAGGGGGGAVSSVFGRTGSVVAQSGDYESNQITESATNLFYTNARARDAINVTTNNNSGLATYNSATGVINVPNYTLSGLGGVPTSRSLTINGTTYDLTADRTWTIPAVTSVSLTVPTGLSVSGSPVTSSGTLAIAYASGYSIPTTTSQSNWDSAYTATNAATSSNTVSTIVKRDASGKFITTAVQADYIDYVPTTNLNRPPYLKGRLYYNSEASSLVMYSDNPDVELLIGERTWIRCRNITGAPIPKGAPVYVSAGVHIPGNPVHGHHMDVAMADASNFNKVDVVGIAAETIADGAHGYVVSKGYLTGIDTSALIVGDRIHLGFQQPGTLVADAPEYPNFPIDLGICLTESDISPRNISSITLSNPVLVTTTAAHNFEDFLQISFAGISGTTQLNGNSYYVDTINSTQFYIYTDVNLSVSVDGSSFTPYISGGTVTPVNHYGAIYVDLQNHTIEKLRVVGSGYFDGNLTVGGDLTIIGSSSNISVSSLNVADNWVYVGAGDTVTASFTGTGLNDLSFKGHYTGTINRTFYVKISSVGATDTFSWSYDDFATTEGSNITITGAEQTLAFGIKVKFEAVTGHTLNDKWNGIGTIKNVDFGFYGNYSTPNYTHAGFFRDATDGEFKFFSSYTPEITGNVDTTDPSFTLATLRAGTFIGNLTGNASSVTDGVYTSNTYNNPAWITGLAWSKITSVPANLTSLAGLTYVSGAFVKMTGTNTFTLDTSTYLTANQSITLSGDLSGSGTTSISATIANQAVTYAKIQNVADNRILGRSSGTAGTVQEITIGSGLQLSGGILSSTSGGGSVTTVSVVSANGFAGTVANASSTPAITLTTTISGLLKGNGTAISAAVGNTDYLAVNNPKYTGILETGSLSFGPQASNVLAALESSANSYNQFLVQNSSTGVNASSDIIVNNNVSTDTEFYGDYGINSSNYNGAGSFNIPSAVYLYSASTDLVLGTFGNAPIHFVVNGGTTDAAVIKTTRQFQLPAYTSSTSFTGTAAGYLAFTSAGDVITVSVPTASAYTVISVSTTHNETVTSGTKVIKADTTSGAFSINLPTAIGNTATIIIKKTAGTAALTVDASGSQTIDGGLTAVLNKVYESITLVSDNANWQII